MLLVWDMETVPMKPEHGAGTITKSEYQAHNIALGNRSSSAHRLHETP
jgi:hypothetical protein